MNYIEKLQTENRALKGTIEKTNQEITDFLTHLRGEKFTGQQSDGSRKDWIATADVVTRLQELRFSLIVNA